MGKKKVAPVRAGGGIVTRLGKSGKRQVLLVHRPHRADWSFPKGKCDSPDESFKAAALREVAEETGFRCAVGQKLPPVTYVDRNGNPKVVQYWEMAVLDGSFTKNDEVEAIEWLSYSKALARLTHGRDRRLLQAMFETADAQAA